MYDIELGSGGKKNWSILIRWRPSKACEGHGSETSNNSLTFASFSVCIRLLFLLLSPPKPCTTPRVLIPVSTERPTLPHDDRHICNASSCSRQQCHRRMRFPRSLAVFTVRLQVGSGVTWKTKARVVVLHTAMIYSVPYLYSTNACIFHVWFL